MNHKITFLSIYNIQIKAVAINEGNPTLTISSISDPPVRIPTVLTETVPDHTSISILLDGTSSRYDPLMKNHHVIMYLPNDAPPLGI